MCLIRLLRKNSIEMEYHFYIEHIKGETNKIADALSRFLSNPFQWLSHKEQANIDSKPTNCSFITKQLVSCYLNNV